MEKNKNKNSLNLKASLIKAVLFCSLVFVIDKSLSYLSEPSAFLENADQEYDASSLYVVLYHDHYYITDFNLKELGTNRIFHVIDWNMEEEPLGIRENDMITFLSFTNSMGLQKETYTLTEAKFIVENFREIHSLFPSYIPTENFQLVEDPFKIGKEFTLESDKKYSIYDLFIIYKNGNLFLCQEEEQFFSLIDVPENSSISFLLNAIENGNTNEITSSQIKNFFQYVKQFQKETKEYLSGKEAYQLLEAGLAIVGSPFQEKKNDYCLLFPYPFAQIKEAKLHTRLGYQYLAQYYNSINRFYDFSKTYVIEFSYDNFLLIEGVYYDELENRYFVKPICSNFSNSTWVSIGSNEIENLEGVGLDHLLTLSDLVEQDPLLCENLFHLKEAPAELCYQILETYLVTHGYQIDYNPGENAYSNFEENDLKIPRRSYYKR